jgi:hypothetical protein
MFQITNKRLLIITCVALAAVVVGAVFVFTARSSAQNAQAAEASNDASTAMQDQLTNAQDELGQIKDERDKLAAQVSAIATPDPNQVTYTVTKDGYGCPEISEIVGGNPDNWRPVDVNLDDVLSTKADGCGYVLLNWQKLSLTVDLPEGYTLDKPSKTYGPAVIHTFNEPVTLWFPGYEEAGECPAATTLALGTSEDDWTRLDANNDGKIVLEDDWCGYLLTSWDSKNLTFNAVEGTEVDQSTEVHGSAQYDTNRLPATIWIDDPGGYVPSDSDK